MCLHFVALFTVFVLPKLMRGSSIERQSSSSSSSVSIAANKKKNDDTIMENNEKCLKNENSMTNEDNIVMVAKSNKIDHTISEPDDSSSCSSFNSSMNDIRDKSHVRKTDTNYLLKDLISKEVNKIKDETDNLSNLLKEKIEATGIEGLIDKTVSGIVELKDDLMRMNEPEVYGPPSDSLRKRNIANIEMENVKGSSNESTGVDTFLKKEIDAIKKEAVVIPAVLSNGHAK